MVIKSVALQGVQQIPRVEDPDSDEEHEMGDVNKKEMTDEEMEKFDEVRSNAMGTYSEGEWGKAIEMFTDAIKLNPNSAAMFAKRGACFLKLKKPSKCSLTRSNSIPTRQLCSQS